MQNENPITTSPPINDYRMDGYDFTWMEMDKNSAGYTYYSTMSAIPNTTSQINITKNILIDNHNYWGWEKCEIRARIYDVGGIDNLWIYHDFFGDFHSFKSSHNGWYNVTLDIGFAAGLFEYTIHVQAWDVAGNELTYQYTVKGLFAGVLDFINDIWNAITGALSKAWDAVKSAVNFLIKWIVNMVNNAISEIFYPLWNAVNRWIHEIITYIEKIKDYYNLYLSTADKNALYLMFDTMGKLLSTTVVPIFLVISSIMLALNIVMFTVTAMTGGLTELLTSLIPLLMPLIISAFGGSGNEQANTLSEDYIGISLLKYVLDKMFSSSGSGKTEIILQSKNNSDADNMGILLSMLSLLVSILGWEDAETTLSWYENTHYSEIYKEFKYWKTGINKGKVIESCKNDIRSAKTSVVLSAISFSLSIMGKGLSGMVKNFVQLGAVITGILGIWNLWQGFKSITSNKILLGISLLVGSTSLALSISSLIGG